MQSTTLTRKELYELIWSKPMTTVAKDFGVSDVWISKICKEADIPRPPVGYWQKLDAGKNIARKPLPPPKLLASDLVYIKSTTAYSYVERDRRSDEDIVSAPEPLPPVFAESMDEFSARIESNIGKINLPSKIVNLHPMIEKLIKEDARRVADLKKNRWGREPLYQSAAGEKILIALNCLYQMWSQLGARPRVSSGRDLTCSVEFSNSHLPLTFRVRPERILPKGAKPEPATYEFAWSYHGQYSDFRKHESFRTLKDITGETVRSLIIESVVLTEQRLRGSAQDAYEYELRERAEAAARIERRRLAAIKHQREELEQLIASRFCRIDETLVLFDKAEKIRELVAAFDKKYSAHADHMPDFEHWRSWAIDYSNQLDPRHWSAEHVQRWIASFKLKN